MKSWNSFESNAFFSEAVSFAATSGAKPFGAPMPRQAPTE
jgi:hypothetical protein